MCQADHEYITFDDCTYSKEIIDMYPHLKTTLAQSFYWTPLEQDFSNLCDYNLAWSLHCHSRFDDLEVVSRSQVYQKY